MVDIEYNVTGKIFVSNVSDFQKGMKSVPFQLVGSKQNGEKLECEFKYDNMSYLLRLPQNAFDVNNKDGVCIVIRLKNIIVTDTGKYAGELMDENKMKNVCKFLSETFQGVVHIGKCSEIYGNCNVFNGGSDYDVIEEKWLTCVYDKGTLIEINSYTK